MSLDPMNTRIHSILAAILAIAATLPLASKADSSSTLTNTITLDTRGTVSTLTNTITLDTRGTVSTLAALTLSSGTLSPSFAPGTTSYNATVTNATTSITVTPTVTDSTATIKVNGTTVASGVASPSIPLTAEANTITIVVTAQDGVTTTTYTITIDNTPYGNWKAGAFTNPSDANDPSVSGPSATPAHDGITNLMKYAMALDPMICGTRCLPTPSPQGGYLTLTYHKNKTATDVTYTVQASDSLTGNSWNPATTVTSQTDQGTYWLVTVRDTVPSAGHPLRFMRLQVSR
jgi:hypothetical protein